MKTITQTLMQCLIIGGWGIHWAWAQDKMPAFEHQVIDSDIGAVCYAVKIADVDGDGLKDVLAVTENRVLWYEAPNSEKHVIIEDQTERDNVCIAIADIDRDGQLDLALGAGWTKTGTIQWLCRGESKDESWQVFPVGQEPWLHRMHFADVRGTDRPQLVISPLNRTSGQGVRLMAFDIPDDPRRDRWTPIVMNQELDKLHNHRHLDFDNNGTVDTLTASEQGVSLIRRQSAQWTANRLTESGAGEVTTGSLNGQQFVATIEPMHGTDVVAYVAAHDGTWAGHLVDDSLKQGHALLAADLDGDGDDELIVGHREKADGEIPGPGLYIYRAENSGGSHWTKHVIDNGGIAVEDAAAADLNGDGRIDIVAGGRGTRNLKVYWNRR